MLGIVVLMIAYWTYVEFLVKRDDPGISDVFHILREQGYTANIGFNGTYRPGSVIQMMEGGQDGSERQLASPLLFLWGSDCFPDLQPRESQFVLPESAGTAESSLSLSAQALGRLMPGLKLDNSAVATYRLKFDNLRVQTIAKADLSMSFSEKCVAALSQAVEHVDDLPGEKIEWFSVIVAAIVADSLTFEMNWRTGLSGETRAAVRAQVEEQLSGLVGQGEGEVSSGGEVALTLDNEKTTVMAAKGLVVVGYRPRPLQPQYER